MKNLIKYIGVSLIIITFSKCEEKSNFTEPNIQLVPVYTITNISGSNTPVKINIYKEKDLIIEYVSEVNPLSFSSSNFVDSSTDLFYEISVNKIDGQSTINYVISANKATGFGTITIDATTTYNITISEEEVYN